MGLLVEACEIASEIAWSTGDGGPSLCIGEVTDDIADGDTVKASLTTLATDSAKLLEISPRLMTSVA